MKRNRYIAVLLCLLTTFLFAACGKTEMNKDMTEGTTEIAKVIPSVTESSKPENDTSTETTAGIIMTTRKVYENEPASKEEKSSVWVTGTVESVDENTMTIKETKNGMSDGWKEGRVYKLNKEGVTIEDGVKQGSEVMVGFFDAKEGADITEIDAFAVYVLHTSS